MASTRTALKDALRARPAPAVAPVEQPAGVMTAANLDLPPSLLDAKNYRRTFAPEAQREMLDSIKERGQLQPLLIRPNLTVPGRYWIVAGERRWRASSMGIELGELPADFKLACRVRDDITERDHLLAALTENLQREDVPPIEEAEAFLALRRADPPFPVADIAQAVGKTVRYVQQRISLVEKLGDAARAALTAGTISVTQARELTKATAAQQVEALGILAEGRSLHTTDDLAKWIRRGQFPMDRAFFGLTLYNGPVDIDEESGQRFYTDMALVKTLQMEAVKKKAADLRASGYAVVLTKTDEDYWKPDCWQAEHTDHLKPAPASGKLPAGAQRAAVIVVKRDLTVIVYERLMKMPNREASSAPPAKTPAANFEAAPVDPVDECSTGQRHYALHAKTKALQLAVRKSAKAAHVQLILGLLSGGAVCAVRPEDKGVDNRALHWTVEADLAAFRARLGEALLEPVLSGDPWPRLKTVGYSRKPQEVKAYRALWQWTLEDLEDAVTLLVAARCGSFIGYGTNLGDEDLVTAVASDLQVDICDHWEIDDVYLAKLKKAQLQRLARDIHMLTIARQLAGAEHSHPMEFGKLKASEMRDAILAFAQDPANGVRYAPPEMRFASEEATKKALRENATIAGERADA